jgi:uncharacterized membrane protein
VPDTATLAFISYSREDSEFALRLAQDLKTAGARVWLDQLDIKPGVPWDNAIESALSDSPQMLLVLSPSSAKSDNVRNEISYALEAGKVIIPVLYMDCVVPLRLQRTQRIDFRADYAHGLTSLLAYLQVTNPDPAVLQKAAEGDAQRQIAWQAREAQAQKLREMNESRQQEEDERAARNAEAARMAEQARREAEPPPPKFTPPVVPPMPVAPVAVAAVPVAPVPVAAQTGGGLSDKAAGALCYVTVFPAIVFLLMERYSRRPFVRFNALQSILLAVTVFIAQIVLSVAPAIRLVFDLAVIVTWVICIVKASQGEWFKLPLLGKFAMGRSGTAQV